MKVLFENLVTSINSMTNEDSDYPKENLVDKQPTRIAKSTTTSTQLTFLGAGTDFFLFNIHAETGRIRVINNDAASLVSVSGTDISISDSNTIASVSTDLSVFSDGDTFVLAGFDTDGNTGLFTVSGAPGTNSLDVVGTPFSAEGAGNTIRMIKADDPDIDETIDFSWCQDFEDYFAGRVRQVTQWHKNFDWNWIDTTVILDLTISGTGRLGTNEVYAGLVFQGVAKNSGKSQYGAGESVRDSSIFRKTTNGSLLSVDRVLNIDFDINVSCNRNQAAGLLEIFKNNNSDYKVFMLGEFDTLESYTFIYGKIEQKPVLIWDLPDKKSFNVTITQVGGYE